MVIMKSYMLDLGCFYINFKEKSKGNKINLFFPYEIMVGVSCVIQQYLYTLYFSWNLKWDRRG